MNLLYWQTQFDAWFAKNQHKQDSAHDIFHLRRVWATAQKLSAGEEVDWLVVLTACYFHDIVSLPKNHPDSRLSSKQAATMAGRILTEAFTDYPADKLPVVSHAIEAHSFSAGIMPLTLEAKIVQDADRLDALGAIGLARVFAVSESMGASLFDAEDPFARHRPLNDKQFAVDHFQSKLLTLPQTMQTERGKSLARHNADFLVTWMAKLSAELAGEYDTLDEKVINAFSPQK
ncbi:TPA: phosphohydrolase [Citrobacter freundii]